MDKELLFKRRAETTSGMPEADVEIPGIGTVRVRGITRREALVIRGADTRLEGEQMLLAFGMLDPQLTEDEAGRWQAAAGAFELEPVTDKINELSGLNPGAPKEVMKEFESGSDAEFRSLPSAETGHDGGSASDGDVER